MTMKSVSYLALFLAFLPQVSFGALADYNIYFINGVNNSDIEADTSRKALRTLVLPDVPEGNVILLYQRNLGKLSAMFEVARQQAVLDNQRNIYSRFWRCYTAPSPDNCNSMDPNAPNMYEAVMDGLTGLDEMALMQNPQLQSMVSRLHDNYYLQNKKALLIGHSQGNLYVNQLVNILQSFYPNVAACVEVVGVATPATYVVKSGPYETRNDDMIINRARIQWPTGASILPPTWNALGTGIGDWSSHKFVDSYLSPPDLRNRIRAHVVTQTTTDTNGPCLLDCAPYSLTVSAGASTNTTRTLVNGRWTINVRINSSLPAGGYAQMHIYPVYTVGFQQPQLLFANTVLGTNRYTFVFDSALYGTNQIEIRTYTSPTASMNICIDCGSSTGPAACP